MNEILTARDVAELLRLNERTVLRLAQSGGIPAAKIARRWRFRRSVVNDWLEEKMRKMPTERLDELVGSAPASLADALRPELISTDLKSHTKEAVLTELVQLLVDAGVIDAPQAFIRSLLQREETMTTALGGGTAMPHPRHPLSGLFRAPLCVIGRSARGVDFGALDGEPTHLFFLICAPDDALHLKFLAQLTRVLRSGRCVRALLAAPDAGAVIEAVIAAEHPAPPGERADTSEDPRILEAPPRGPHKPPKGCAVCS